MTKALAAEHHQMQLSMPMSMTKALDPSALPAALPNLEALRIDGEPALADLFKQDCMPKLKVLGCGDHSFGDVGVEDLAKVFGGYPQNCDLQRISQHP